jgi:UDP-N-acetylmuramate dehydrogenase
MNFAVEKIPTFIAQIPLTVSYFHWFQPAQTREIYWASPMHVLEHVPLAPLTTFKIGGPARYFVEARSADDVQAAVAYARSHQLPQFVLGGGSNLLVSDRGWPGLVLKVGILGIEARTERNHALYEVGAGEDWDRFVALAVSRGHAGIECMSGIPGSVGGTPVQNVGAYGQEACETIESVQVFDLKDGQVRELCKEACGFSYRTSIFNTSERGRYIILRVTYALTPGTEARITYADLENHFARRDAPPTLAETREAVLQIRAAKGMLLTPGDEDCHSAGSFFKNPVLSEEQFEEVNRRASARNLQIPSYPGLASKRKISAAWLVEHSGFSKGYGEKGVGISRKHALALVNRGGGTAADIIQLKEIIQHRVQHIWGIRLEPEPVFVGFEEAVR